MAAGIPASLMPALSICWVRPVAIVALGLVPVLLLVADPALAEVCDKVAGDEWVPEQGPVNAVTGAWILGWVAVFGVTTAVIALSRSRLLGWLAASLAALLALLPAIMELVGDDDITTAAIREGCWTDISTGTTAMVAFAFVLAAVFFSWMARGHFMFSPSLWKR